MAAIFLCVVQIDRAIEHWFLNVALSGKLLSEASCIDDVVTIAVMDENVDAAEAVNAQSGFCKTT